MGVLTVILEVLLLIAALFMILTGLLQSSNQRGLGAIAGEVTANMNKSKAATVEAKLALGTKIAATVFIVLTVIIWIL